MGLDMYMTRYPRHGELDANALTKIDCYFAYKDKPYYNEEDKPTDEQIAFFEDKLKTTYPAWDSQHKYPKIGIGEEVAYWRKANAVHAFFVDQIQNGEDDCGNYEVPQEVLEDLMNRCKEILANCIMVNGKVRNGYRMTNGKWEAIIEDGMTIINPEICSDLLPTQDGFFFGGTDYDQWYMEDIRDTYQQCYTILKTTDFEKQMLVYNSSW